MSHVTAAVAKVLAASKAVQASDIAKQLLGHAEQGDRVEINGKIAWAGLGNRSGLYDTADVLIREKWAKSGAGFKKKVEALKEGDTVRVLIFQNINRDRGKWVAVQDWVIGDSAQPAKTPTKLPLSQYRPTKATEFGPAWKPTFEKFSKLGGINQLSVANRIPPKLILNVFGVDVLKDEPFKTNRSSPQADPEYLFWNADKSVGIVMFGVFGNPCSVILPSTDVKKYFS